MTNPLNLRLPPLAASGGGWARGDRSGTDRDGPLVPLPSFPGPGVAAADAAVVPLPPIHRPFSSSLTSFGSPVSPPLSLPPEAMVNPRRFLERYVAEMEAKKAARLGLPVSLPPLDSRRSSVDSTDSGDTSRLGFEPSGDFFSATARAVDAAVTARLFPEASAPVLPPPAAGGCGASRAILKPLTSSRTMESSEEVDTGIVLASEGLSPGVKAAVEDSKTRILNLSKSYVTLIKIIMGCLNPYDHREVLGELRHLITSSGEFIGPWKVLTTEKLEEILSKKDGTFETHELKKHLSLPSIKIKVKTLPDEMKCKAARLVQGHSMYLQDHVIPAMLFEVVVNILRVDSETLNQIDAHLSKAKKAIPYNALRKIAKIALSFKNLVNEEMELSPGRPLIEDDIYKIENLPFVIDAALKFTLRSGLDEDFLAILTITNFSKANVETSAYVEELIRQINAPIGSIATRVKSLKALTSETKRRFQSFNRQARLFYDQCQDKKRERNLYIQNTSVDEGIKRAELVRLHEIITDLEGRLLNLDRHCENLSRTIVNEGQEIDRLEVELKNATIKSKKFHKRLVQMATRLETDYELPAFANCLRDIIENVFPESTAKS